MLSSDKIKTEKFFSFRFDVDTHKCLEQGLPALVALGRETGARFTFFVTMGQAVSRAHYFEKFFKKGLKKTSQNNLAKLSNFKKLGFKDYFRAAVFNPDVGRRHSSILRLAESEGHEIGLHGGLNHAFWQNEAMAWDQSRLADEVDWGLNEIEKAGLNSPKGFSSPGWKSPDGLADILKSRGFSYKADLFGLNYEGGKLIDSIGLVEFPTNIVGQGGVGFIESGRALGKNTAQIFNDFKENLSSKQFALVYDHPYYAGVKELSLIRDMIMEAKNQGFKMVTLAERLNA